MLGGKKGITGQAAEDNTTDVDDREEKLMFYIHAKNDHCNRTYVLWLSITLSHKAYTNLQRKITGFAKGFFMQNSAFNKYQNSKPSRKNSESVNLEKIIANDLNAFIKSLKDFLKEINKKEKYNCSTAITLEKDSYHFRERISEPLEPMLDALMDSDSKRMLRLPKKCQLGCWCLNAKEPLPLFYTPGLKGKGVRPRQRPIVSEAKKSLFRFSASAPTSPSRRNTSVEPDAEPAVDNHANQQKAILLDKETTTKCRFKCSIV